MFDVFPLTQNEVSAVICIMLQLIGNDSLLFLKNKYLIKILT